MRSRSLGARSCCKNRYLVTLTFATLERNRGSRAQMHKNSTNFVNLLVHGRLQQPAAAGGTVETGQMSSVETRQMSQQQSSVLSQQQTSVLSQQKTSILSQQTTSVLFQHKTTPLLEEQRSVLSQQFTLLKSQIRGWAQIHQNGPKWVRNGCQDPRIGRNESYVSSAAFRTVPAAKNPAKSGKQNPVWGLALGSFLAA